MSTAAPLDPWKLAEHLAIPVVGISTMAAEARTAVVRLTKIDPSSFSAVTVFRGYKRMIVVNDAHSRRRQASDLAHELAHCLLLHEPRPAFDGDGVRAWDEDEEDEADWVAGALLVSDEAAVAIVRRGLSIRDATRLYGVSVRMMQFRINVTGAHKRVERAERYRS